jgi:hypothetical protein
MNPDLHSLSEQVHDEATFIDFLRALAADREEEVEIEARSPGSPYGPGANGWENGTIESFLGAAAAWADGSKHGPPLDSPNENPWARCATILLMGKHYE